MMRKGWMFAVISAIITVVWLAVLYGINQDYHDNADKFKEVRSQLMARSIESVTSSYEQFSNFIFETIVNTEDVTNMMAQANEASEEEKAILREQLYEDFETIYHISNQYEFRQLHFHLKDGESFLRMHAKDKFGDPLFDIRESVRLANEEQQYITGFEEGRIFNGYRFVYPLFHESVHVGSVEVSISLKSIVNILNEMYPSTVIGFILDRDVMEATVFSDEQSHYRLAAVSDEYVIDKEIYDTQLSINQRLFNHPAFFKLYQQTISPHLPLKQSFTGRFNYQGQDYVVIYLATENIEGRPIGYYSFVLPTDEFTPIVSSRNVTVITATVIYLLMAVLLYILYQRQQAILTLATQDPLTGLYNRHRFSQLVTKQLKENKPHALMILDIDHFKRVNDTFGHNVGDDILVELANLMKKTLTNGEIFARHGGEEFVVFFPHTALAHAKVVADTLKHAVETTSFTTVGQVTISIGLTNAVANDSLIEIVERADQALYDAKRNGRNQVVMVMAPNE